MPGSVAVGAPDLDGPVVVGWWSLVPDHLSVFQLRGQMGQDWSWEKERESRTSNTVTAYRAPAVDHKLVMPFFLASTPVLRIPGSHVVVATAVASSSVPTGAATAASNGAVPDVEAWGGSIGTA